MDLLKRWSDRAPGGAAGPFVTYYDMTSGERTELSGTTLANWVAKLANLLVDDCDAEAGVRVHPALPSHWLRIAAILATWAVGGIVTDAEPDIAVLGPKELAAPGPARFRLASALLPFGLPFPEPPPGAIDLGRDLPGQPDVFVPIDPPTDLTDLSATVTPLAGRRLHRPGSLDRDVELVLATALGGGSIVLVSGGSDPDLERIAAQEHAEIG